ncbi:MAG: hypothetical protein HYY06_08405 [Deltaproteobacteria bacterium]|nr:hypothetical protein [Deltaproteobacteria bacterium]
MRRALPLSLVVIVFACLDSSPEERGTANLEIVDNTYDSMKKLDLGDLVWGAGHLATDELNDLLAEIPYADIRLSDTELYGLPERAARDNTIHDITALAAGLADRFGETSLPARVNALRRAHLVSSNDRVFAETSFRLGASVDPELWHGEAPGLGEGGTSIGVGFEAGANVEARVIAAYRDELDSLEGNPLQAVSSVRGFVLPRDLLDVREGMKPGESLAYAGEGRLGLNFGVGVPLLVANPLESVTYSIVLSGGLRTVLRGNLDAQIVRLDGDEAILDVGMSNARVHSAYLAIDDAFGVSGLVKSSVSIGPVTLDVGKILDHALSSELDRRLSLISARVERRTSSVRESVARFRIDLGAATPLVQVAVEQALRGDIRLAQGLANRGEPGLTSELDVMRSGRSTYGHLGFAVLGMKFFTETERAEGQAVVQAPGGALSVMFDSLRHESGLFFSRHGYARTVLAGIETAGGEEAQGRANLYFSWTESDEYMERDKLADHLDELLLLALGPEGQGAVTAILDEIGQGTQAACAGLTNFDADNGEAYRRCKMGVLSRPAILAKATRARAAFDEALAASGPAASEAAIARAAFELELAANRAYEPAATLAGPPTAIALGSWLSDAALGELVYDRTGADFRRALEEVVPVLAADRDRVDGLARARRRLDDMGSLEVGFDDFRRRYQDLVRLATEEVPGIGVLGDETLTVTVPVDRDLVPQYEDLAVRSIARARAQLVARMVDSTIREIGDHVSKPERAFGHALLRLTEPSMRDVRVDVDMDLDDNWAQDFPQYRQAGYQALHASSRGPDVRLMGESIAWDVDRLVMLE